MSQGKWFLKQTIGLSVASIVIAVISFLKESIFAAVFGATAVADAYTVAIQTPEILFAIVWEAINGIVIPLYSKELYDKTGNEKKGFISKFFTLIILFSLSVVIVIELGAEQIIFLISPGLSQNSHELAVSLIRWIAPMTLFEGVIRIGSGVLNVHKQYIIPKCINTIRNIIYICFLLLFTNRFGIYAAAYGIVTGVIIECIISCFFSRKHVKFHLDLKLKDKKIKQSLKMMIPLSIGIGTTQLNQIVDKVVASWLQEGSMAMLNYSTKISSIISIVVLRNTIEILYPLYSKYVATNESEKLANMYKMSMKILIAICFPLIIGGFILREELISIAFERGEFSRENVIVVAMLFSIYMFSELFTVIRLNATRIFSSYLDTRTPMINSTIGICINVILNVILSRYWGIYGLAFATLISSGIVSVRLMFLSFRLIGTKILKEDIIFGIKVGVSSIIMYITLMSIKEVCFSHILSNTFWIKAMYICIMVIIGCAIYLLTHKLIKTKELMLATNILFKRKEKYEV